MKKILLYAKCIDGKLDFDNKREYEKFCLENNKKSVIVPIERETGLRTPKQSDSIHLYLSLVAKELINKGYTLQNVVEKIQKAEIIPNTENLKEVAWKPMQYAVLKTRSTRELSKTEVDEVYEPLSMFFSKHFEIDLPFPSQINK